MQLPTAPMEPEVSCSTVADLMVAEQRPLTRKEAVFFRVICGGWTVPATLLCPLSEDIQTEKTKPKTCYKESVLPTLGDNSILHTNDTSQRR